MKQTFKMNIDRHNNHTSLPFQSECDFIKQKVKELINDLQ